MGKRIIYELAGVLTWDVDDEPMEDEDDDDFVQRVTGDISLETWGAAVDIDGWEIEDRDDDRDDSDENPPVSTLNQEQHELVVATLEFYLSNQEDMPRYENDEDDQASDTIATEAVGILLATMTRNIS